MRFHVHFQVILEVESKRTEIAEDIFSFQVEPFDVTFELTNHDTTLGTFFFRCRWFCFHAMLMDVGEMPHESVSAFSLVVTQFAFESVLLKMNSSQMLFDAFAVYSLKAYWAFDPKIKRIWK